MLDDNGANVGRFITRASTTSAPCSSTARPSTATCACSATSSRPARLPSRTSSRPCATPTAPCAWWSQQRRSIDTLIASSTGFSTDATTFLAKNEANLVGTVYAGEPIVHVYDGRRERLADLLQAVPHVLSNGAHGVRDGKIVMEGLMQFPFEFGRPYNAGDCTRYVGATGSNCRGGGSYPSPYRGHR